MKIKPSRIILIQSLMAIGLISVGFSSWIRVENKGDNAQISNIEIGDVIDERGWISRTNVTKLEYCSDGFVNDGEVGNIGFMSFSYTIDIKKMKTSLPSSTSFIPTFLLKQIDSNASSYSLITALTTSNITYSTNLSSTPSEITGTVTSDNISYVNKSPSISISSGLEICYITAKYTFDKSKSGFSYNASSIASVKFLSELLLEVN